MNIELTALQAGSIVMFSITVTGIVMALRKRVLRNKKQNQVKSDVDEHKFKTNSETHTAEKTPKQLEPAENLVTDNNKSEKRVDVDELLETLKRDENAEK